MLTTKFALTRIGVASTSRNGLSRQQFLSNNTNEAKTLSPDILSILQDPNFWVQPYELQNLLFLLCGILNRLQKILRDFLKLCIVLDGLSRFSQIIMIVIFLIT